MHSCFVSLVVEKFNGLETRWRDMDLRNWEGWWEIMLTGLFLVHFAF